MSEQTPKTAPAKATLRRKKRDVEAPVAAAPDTKTKPERKAKVARPKTPAHVPTEIEAIPQQQDLLGWLPVPTSTPAPTRHPEPESAPAPALERETRDIAIPATNQEEPVHAPEPALPSATAATRTTLSMAERASRFSRRPPAVADEAPRSAPVPLSMAERALRAGQHHRTVVEPVAPRPKPLDMAEIAERNRLARQATRGLADVPALEPAGEPRTQPSMAERAARHTLQHRVQATPEPAPDGAQRPAVAPPAAAEAVTMAERAADAVHRRREAAAPAQTREAIAGTQTDAIHASCAVFLVSRNHAPRIGAALQTWKQVIDSVDVRWWMLDLGSTDDSVALADAAHVPVLYRPGGLAQPFASLDAAVRAARADIVVVLDADAQPSQQLAAVLPAVRRGAHVAAAPARHPVALAISTANWTGRGATDTAFWLQTNVTWLPASGEAASSRGLVAALFKPEFFGVLRQPATWPDVLRGLARRYLPF